MNDSCVLVPIVKGKRSKLYNKIKDFTSNNRPLTNLIYGFATTDEVSQLFTNDEKDSLGEVKFEELDRKYNLSTLLNSAAQLHAKAMALGAVDSSGTMIEYDDVNTIFDRVIDFNDTESDYKATIIFDNVTNKFKIKVDIINADNYLNEIEYRKRKAQHESILQYLANIRDMNGHSLFDLNFSPEVSRVFNPLNTYSNLEMLKTLSQRQSFANLNEFTIRLLIDFFKSSGQYQRLLNEVQNNFTNTNNEDLIAALKYISEGNTPNQPVHQLAETFLNYALTQLHKIIPIDIHNMSISAGERAVSNINPRVFGINSTSVKDVLSYMYDTFHVNQEITLNTKDKIDKVSEALEKIIRIQRKKIELTELKTGKQDKAGRKKLEKLEKGLENGNYCVNILEFLRETVAVIDLLKNNIHGELASVKEYKEHKTGNYQTQTMNKLNKLSKSMIALKDLCDSVEPLLMQMSDMQSIINDDSGALSTAISDIQNIVDNIKQDISGGNNVFGVKQLLNEMTGLVAYCSLRTAWGGTKIIEGNEITFDTVWNAATMDVGIMDRLLYAATETSDVLINLASQIIKEQHKKRDAELREILFDIRQWTDELYSAGFDSSFMYVFDENGVPTGKLLSDYDWQSYYRDKEAYRQSLKAMNLSKADIKQKMEQWVSNQIGMIKPLEHMGIDDFEVAVPINYNKHYLSRLSAAQKTYYDRMMLLKYKLGKGNGQKLNFYTAVQIEQDTVSSLMQAASNPTQAFTIFKNKMANLFTIREDDPSYGEILEDNGIATTKTDFRGHEVRRLPLFYTHALKDKTRMSTDFSRSIAAMAGASINYDAMNSVVDTLMIIKDYLTSRKVVRSKGERVMLDIWNGIKGEEATAEFAIKENPLSNSLIEDIFERNLFGRKKSNEGADAAKIFGIPVSKLADTAIGYSSISGLSLNILGAQANLFMGKLQMWIETGLGLGGEFFGVKDYVKANELYWRYVLEFLGEINSNNKSSFLGLLSEYFDVQDDFFSSIAETGFFKNPISKIIGNKSLFMLYGLGEHMLHCQTMFAVLNRNKCLNNRNEKVSLWDAFDIKKIGKNGKLVIKSGYKNLDGSPLTLDDDYLDKIRRQIKYCNKSMHGAFGDDDKGMAHRYAFGRLVMNFRQWMPAHYRRRFGGRYYDADLQDYREGMYVSTYNFLKDCAAEISKSGVDFIKVWNNLDDRQKYNVKRTLAEFIILCVLTAVCNLLSSLKDDDSLWRRNIIYQLKRIQQESIASFPIPIPGTGYGITGFVENIITILNKPVASITSVSKALKLLDFTDMFVDLKSGPHKGENKWWNNFKKTIPLYGQFIKFMGLEEEDALFNLFKFNTSTSSRNSEGNS